MIAEGLKFLADLAKASMVPILVDTGDPEAVTYLVGGQSLSIARAVPPRKHEADSVEAIIGLIRRFDQCTVWVDADHVRIVIDDADDEHRANMVTMDLVQTDVFERLTGLSQSKEWLDQKAFVRLLRIDLAGTLAPGLLLDRVRKLRFESGQVATQEVVKNRESMGRQITSQVSADGELPDTVTLESRVFRDREKFAIVCSVDVDPVRGLLQLSPLPDEVARVTALAVLEVMEEISGAVGENVPVYNGRP